MNKLFIQKRPASWLRLCSLLIALLPLAGRAQVVISEVYGGGGSSTATYTTDYIELHNNAATAQTLTGYSVQYAAATGTSWSVTNIPTVTLQPGAYYLVGESVGAGLAALPVVANTSGNIAMSGTAGKVALVSSTAALTGACPNGATVVDFVGYGTNANCFEGAGRAPAPSTTTADIRGNNGCTDSNNNNLDFAVGAPSPRNAGSTRTPCAAPPAEINVKQGATDYFTASTYSGFAITTIGSSDAKVFTIENTGGTALSISSVTAAGDFSVSGAPTTVAANSTATLTVSFAPTAAGTRTGTLTIASSDADEPSYVINLSGQGQSASANPEINVRVGSTDYLTASTYSGFASTATGASSAAVTFTIQNISTTDALSISSIATTGDFSASGLTTPASVPANGTATVDVVFAPTATGPRSGTLVINSNDPNEATYTIALEGEGVNAVPAIGTLAPSSATAGNSDFTLTVNGSGFAAGAVVSFNGTNRATAFVSATQLTAAILAADVATAGPYDVVVTNPAPGGGASSPATFTVDPLPAPTLTGISPGTITAGTAATVTFTGTNFVSGATVSFNGATLATTFVSGTTVRASITPPAQSATATYQVSVTTPSGTTAPRMLTATGVFTLVPISIAAVNVPVTENFNTLAATGTAAKTTLPSGFDFVETDTGADAFYNTGTGSLATGDTYSFGTAAADRALGTLLSGSVTSRFGAQYINNTGQAITSLAISYTGEEWRLGSAGRIDRLDFQYSLNATGANTGTFFDFNPLDFVTPNTAGTGAKDGNLAANSAPVTATITGLAIPDGATFFIRWVDADATNADDGLAVDDLSVTANPAPVACAAPSAPTFSNITPTSADVTVAPGANGTGPFTVTATPTAGGAAVVASGASPVPLTGLTAATSYMVTVTSDCNSGYSSPSQPSTAVTLTTAPAPTATLRVRRNKVSYPSNGAAYAFGNQTLGTTGSAVGFTLANNGTGPLTVSGIGTTGDFAVNGPTPTTIAAGDTAVVSVTFAPTVTGTRPGTLVLTSNSTTDATYTLNLTGTGVAATPNPLIAVSQGTTGIANSGSFSGFAATPLNTNSPAVTFTIANASGTDNLVLGAVSATGNFSVSSAPAATVAPNGSTTFTVTFRPTTGGTNAGTVTIPNNSQANSPYVFDVSGQAQLTDLTVSSTQTVGGIYNNVTITSAGKATLGGTLTVYGTLTVDGWLATDPNGNSCPVVDGPGSFVLNAGGRIEICDPAGITTSGATGFIQVTGTRAFNSDAIYFYTSRFAQVTGSGLPARIRFLSVGNGLNGNPGGVTLSQDLSMSSQARLFDCNLITNGYTFTLLSTAADRGYVTNSGGVVVGATTVQRYIDNSTPIGYRHYSTPVSNTTVNDLAAPGFTPVFNPTYNASPSPSTVTPFPTVFGYDQARIFTVSSDYAPFDQGWFSPASGAPMTVGRGYTANVPNTALIDFVGTLNNGNVNSGTLSRGATPNSGWQLLGNPYPEALDWSSLSAPQRAGMDAAVWVFQSSGQYSGTYRSYANGVAVPNIPNANLIGIATGFFARVAIPNTTGFVNLTNSNRAHTGFGTAFGRGTADPRPRLQLQVQGNGAADDLAIYFQAGASAGADAEYDAIKLTNPSGLNLASLANGQEMAINGLPVLGNAPVLVPLTVHVPQAGSYRLAATELANFAGTVTLIDGLAGTRTVLATGTGYTFTLAGASATGRFSVEFRAANVLATTAAQALSAQVQLFPNPASGSFQLQLPVLSSKATVAATLVNALGQPVLTRSLSAPAGQALDAAFDVHGLPAGVYTLRLNVNGTPLVRKVLVE